MGRGRSKRAQTHRRSAARATHFGFAKPSGARTTSGCRPKWEAAQGQRTTPSLEPKWLRTL
eukprot:13831767-Alexandrium_andersonii.AAC.1